MKAWFWKGMLAAAISFSLLSGSIGKAAQQQQGQEQRGIEGVWDIIVTGVSCATGAHLVARIDRLAARGGRYRRAAPVLTSDIHRAIQSEPRSPSSHPEAAAQSDELGGL